MCRWAIPRLSLIHISYDAYKLDGQIYRADQQKDDFWAYINQDSYLKKHKGEYVDRGGAVSYTHLRPIEEADNTSIACVIRASVEEHDAPKVGTFYDDPHTDMMFQTFNIKMQNIGWLNVTV